MSVNWLCCYCTSKTRKSESNSQHLPARDIHNKDHLQRMSVFVVIALVKLENLKAIHNPIDFSIVVSNVVIALVKLENLKAIHNNFSI